MIASHQVEQWFARQAAVMPATVKSSEYGTDVTSAAILGTVRYDLLSSIVYGPKYRRGVADNLARALRAFKMEDADTALMWLGDAVKGATR